MGQWEAMGETRRPDQGDGIWWDEKYGPTRTFLAGQLLYGFDIWGRLFYHWASWHRMRKEGGGRSSRRLLKAGGFRVGRGCGIIKGREWEMWEVVEKDTKRHISGFSEPVCDHLFCFLLLRSQFWTFPYCHGQWNTSWKFPTLVALCPDYRQPELLKHSA